MDGREKSPRSPMQNRAPLPKVAAVAVLERARAGSGSSGSAGLTPLAFVALLVDGQCVPGFAGSTVEKKNESKGLIEWESGSPFSTYQPILVSSRFVS